MKVKRVSDWIYNKYFIVDYNNIMQFIAVKRKRKKNSPNKILKDVTQVQKIYVFSFHNQVPQKTQYPRKCWVKSYNLSKMLKK